MSLSSDTPSASLSSQAPLERGASLVDIGVNLTNKRFEPDLPLVLSRAYEAGVAGLIITGVDEESSRRALELCLAHPPSAEPPFSPHLWSTAGVHPHDSGATREGYLKRLETLISSSPERIVAVGECGLDYDRDYSPRDAQRACFEAQLELAERLDKPLFLHERAAGDDFYAMMRAAGPERCARSVVHCFTGSARDLERYLHLGCSIGITGWLCDERRGEELRALAPHIPLERLMIETDAPYLTPRSLRPKPKKGRNEPATLPHIAHTLATLRDEEPETLWRSTTHNAARLFGLHDLLKGGR